MLSDEQIEQIAVQHVAKCYPSDCVIVHRECRESPPGVYFIANHQSEDPFDIYIGDGGFFVTRETGEIWRFGSGQLVHEGLDYWLAFYSQGWRTGCYRLAITDVKRPQRLTQLLLGYRLEYTLLELECGTVWSRRVPYTDVTLESRLAQLPCEFSVDGVRLSGIVPRLSAERMAEFRYAYIGEWPKYDSNPDNYVSGELGPRW